MFFFFFQAEDGIRDYKVTGVQTCALPILHARALLLIAPSFEAYVVEERISIANWRTHLGEAGTSALSALVTASFVAAGTRRLADVDVLPLLAGPADTSGADFLLAPSLNSARERHRQVSVLEPPGADRPGCEHLADLLFHKDACKIGRAHV